MPNLTPVAVSLTINQQVTLHTNPQDAANDPTVPTTAYTWGNDTPSVGALTPSGAALKDALFVVSAPGTTHITATNLAAAGQEISNWTITVTAGPFDHSAPSADAPVPKGS